MDELSGIRDQLQRSYFEKSWHGPAVKQVLAGVTAVQAAARPLPRAHSIWEIVLHMAAWKNYVHRTVGGEDDVKVPDEVNWPPVRDTTEEAWRAALKQLDDEHAKLTACAAAVDPAGLGAPRTKHGTTVYQLLHGAIQHDLYHAGQIRILAK